MATPTRVKVDKLLCYASVDREIHRENPNHKTNGYIRVKREQASFVLRWEMETYGVGNVSSAITGQRAHSIAVEVMFWRHVRHKQCPHGMMAMSEITIRLTGQCVDCGKDWDVEATGCDLKIVFAFAAALLHAGRSRRRRGVTDVNAVVGPDASTGTSPRLAWVLASSSSPDSPSTVSAVELSSSASV